MGTASAVSSTSDHVRQHVVGRVRSRVTVIAVPIAPTGLTFESHLISDFKRLA